MKPVFGALCWVWMYFDARVWCVELGCSGFVLIVFLAVFFPRISDIFLQFSGFVLHNNVSPHILLSNCVKYVKIGITRNIEMISSI